ncbi:histone-lysine N-methyltransferase PRDM9-like [Trichomycterus rosablanca]|uniref:histone-lysine N-methyltransferase PRDM9-like n=1 Tax=Trichomycterus rosablanca TaxID=2290929 RepID=UPI002F3611C3
MFKMKSEEEVQTEASTTSDGGTLGSVEDTIAPVDQQNLEFQIKPVKEEPVDEDEEFLNEGAWSPVEHVTSMDQQKEQEEDCEECRSFFIGKCEVHSPALFIPDTPVPMGVVERARRTLPPGLEVRESGIPDAGLGVFNEGGTVPVGAHFGPYQGEVVDKEEAMKSCYSWVIYTENQIEEYIDARSELNSNWMRYVNCARNDEEQNLVAFQYGGGILYRCCRPIQPGHELLVCYTEEYAKDLGSTFDHLWNIKCSSTELQIFSCSLCPLFYTAQIYLHKHIKWFHHEEYARLLRSGEIKSENLVPTKTSKSQTTFSGTNMPHTEMLRKAECSSHIEKRNVPTEGKSYQCLQCGKRCIRISHLREHQRIHTGEKPYQCSQCGKSFAHLSNFRQHQRIHTGEKPHLCSHCGRGFANQHSLQHHRLLHTGEKPYRCLNCGRGFTQQSSLQRHQLIHTGEKPHPCFQCGKSFTEKSHLQEHQRIHTQEKPYGCSLCEKCFTRMSHLQRHQRTHTGEKPHYCPQCGRTFAQPSALKRHQRIHTREDPLIHLQQTSHI